MQYSSRQKRLREQRSAFFLSLGAALVYLIAGLPVIAASLASSSQHAASHVLPSFATLDRNRDGYVDSSEAAGFPAYAAAFSRADRNGDGRLNAAEYAAARASVDRAP
jgi:EF hand domain-containing protein